MTNIRILHSHCSKILKTSVSNDVVHCCFLLRTLLIWLAIFPWNSKQALKTCSSPFFFDTDIWYWSKQKSVFHLLNTYNTMNFRKKTCYTQPLIISLLIYKTCIAYTEYLLPCFRIDYIHIFWKLDIFQIKLFPFQWKSWHSHYYYFCCCSLVISSC